MDPLSLALILGGTGLAKSLLVDQPAASRNRKLQAEKTRWAPWTGDPGKDVADADPLGSTLQGAGAGYSLGQNVQNADAARQQQAAQTQLLQALTRSPQVSIGEDPLSFAQASPNSSPLSPRWMR